MGNLRDKTIVITGASRGIGREIALRCAEDRANIVIAAKSQAAHPRLSGTIFSVASEIERIGGNALPLKVDVRSETDVKNLVDETVRRFGGIDCLINNAGAIALSGTEDTPIKRFDLMHQINVRAVFLCSQAVLPYLKKAKNPHILNLSPPLSLDPKWYQNFLAYTLSKFGMSMCTLGMAEEFKKFGIAVNSLWPKTAIASAATQMLLGEDQLKFMRKPSIMADAAYPILTSEKLRITGRCLLDEDWLRSEGIVDFEKYAMQPGVELIPDFYVETNKAQPFWKDRL